MVSRSNEGIALARGFITTVAHLTARGFFKQPIDILYKFAMQGAIRAGCAIALDPESVSNTQDWRPHPMIIVDLDWSADSKLKGCISKGATAVTVNFNPELAPALKTDISIKALKNLGITIHDPGVFTSNAYMPERQGMPVN